MLNIMLKITMIKFNKIVNIYRTFLFCIIIPRKKLNINWNWIFDKLHRELYKVTELWLYLF